MNRALKLLRRVHFAKKAASKIRRKARRLNFRKKGHHQYLVLDELLETEYQYGVDLRIIVKHIQIPLQRANLINSEIQHELFGCLPQIILMSDMMLGEIRALQRKWEPQNTLIGTALELFLTQFRQYNEYKAFSEQSKGNTRGEQIFKAISHRKEYEVIESNFSEAVNAELRRQGRPAGGFYRFDTFLMKPTQRLARYKLFLQRYQKLLPAHHKEKTYLIETIRKFDAAVQSYQDKLNSQEHLQLYNKLSRLYQPIVGVNSTRRLIDMLESHTLQQEEVKVYLFTDMVLLTRQVRHQEEMLKVVEIDQNSFVHVFPDGKYIDKVLTICGNCECCELRFTDSKMLSNVAVKIDQIIQQLIDKEAKRRLLNDSRSANKMPPKFTVLLAENRIDHAHFSPNFRVTVEGVERRYLPGMRQQTSYVLKVALPRPYDLCQYIYCRYSTFEHIEQFIRKRYPQVILPRLKPQLMEVDMFQLRKNRSMALEYRMIVLTTFLNVILRCHRVMANPIYIIDELRIDEFLWEFAIENKEKVCRCDCCTYPTISQERFTDDFLKVRSHYIKKAPFLTRESYCMRNHLKLRGMYLAQPIVSMDSYYKVLLYLQYKQQRSDEALTFKRNNKNKQQITVAMIHPGGQTVRVEVHPNTTVGDVIKNICCQMEHFVWFDYGLFADYQDVPRLLDNDEFILSVLAQFEPNGNSNESGMVEQFRAKLSSIKTWGSELLTDKKPRLYMKKYLFLHPQLQHASYLQNHVRLRWVVEQAFYQVHSKQLWLNPQEMVEMVGLFLLLTDGKNAYNISHANFPHEHTRKILPGHCLTMFPTEEIFEQKVITSVYLLLTGRPTATELLLRVIQLVEDKPSWFTSLFRVSNHDQKSLMREVLVGINHTNFVILEQGRNEPLVAWSLFQTKYKVTAFSLYLEFNEHGGLSSSTNGKDVKRFDGPMLFNFDRLMQRYRLYNKLFLSGRPSNMGRDIVHNRVSC